MGDLCVNALYNNIRRQQDANTTDITSDTLSIVSVSADVRELLVVAKPSLRLGLGTSL